MTQNRIRPPTFTFFSNTPEGIKPPYRRYLSNRLRGDYNFEGSPHIDTRNIAPFFGLALGPYSGTGGKLRCW